MFIQQVNGTIIEPRQSGTRPIFYAQIALASMDGLESFLDNLINFAFDTLQANLDLRITELSTEERQVMELS